MVFWNDEMISNHTQKRLLKEHLAGVFHKKRTRFHKEECSIW